MKDKRERQQIWESYINNEASPDIPEGGLAAGKVGDLHPKSCAILTCGAEQCWKNENGKCTLEGVNLVYSGDGKNLICDGFKMTKRQWENSQKQPEMRDASNNFGEPTQSPGEHDV